MPLERREQGPSGPSTGRECYAGFSPGPEGPMILGPNFVGRKPHAPSIKQLERLLYIMERTALNCAQRQDLLVLLTHARIRNPAPSDRSRPGIPGCRCGRAGVKSRRQRCRSRGPRGRRVQRKRAHGPGGDAEGIGIAGPGAAGFPGAALGFGFHQRPDPGRHSPTGRRRDGAGQSH